MRYGLTVSTYLRLLHTHTSGSYTVTIVTSDGDPRLFFNTYSEGLMCSVAFYPGNTDGATVRDSLVILFFRCLPVGTGVAPWMNMVFGITYSPMARI